MMKSLKSKNRNNTFFEITKFVLSEVESGCLHASETDGYSNWKCKV